MQNKYVLKLFESPQFLVEIWIKTFQNSRPSIFSSKYTDRNTACMFMKSQLSGDNYLGDTDND